MSPPWHYRRVHITPLSPGLKLAFSQSAVTRPRGKVILVEGNVKSGEEAKLSHTVTVSEGKENVAHLRSHHQQGGLGIWYKLVYRYKGRHGQALHLITG